MGTPGDNTAGTIDGVAYEEPIGSGSVSFTQSGAQGKRIFHIDWDDRQTLANSLMGYYTSSGDATAPTYFVTNPATFPGWDNLRCTSVAISGLGAMTSSGGDPAYPYARVEATYTPRKDSDANNTREEQVLETEELDIAGELLEFGGMRFKWGTSGTEISKSIPAGKRIVLIHHRITEENSPTSKKTTIAAAAGKVNSQAFLGVDVGKVLYLGAQVSRQITTSGEQPWKIVHNFVERPEAPWNEFYNENSGKRGSWETLINAETDEAYTPYESYGFSTLLT